MISQSPAFSIVSPVYRAESIVPKLVEQIIANITPISADYEIILVEDGGPDDSWGAIEVACRQNPRVKGIKLSRNFGQHYAITAGLDLAAGEWVIVMDCDLQDKPSEFAKLYAKAISGYDIVLARRIDRQDNFSKRLFSKLFYRSLGYLTGIPQDPAVANFGIYHRQVVEAIRTMREPIRYFPTMVKWVGFRRVSVEVVHAEREEGATSYDFRKLIRLAMDIILANSDKPLKITVKGGLMIAMLAFAFGVVTMFRYLAGSITAPGYASLVISIWFLSGLILTVLGVLGLYLGKTFEGIKSRPIYIVERAINMQ